MMLASFSDFQEVDGMGRCIIIAPLYQGEEKEWLAPQEGDWLICADGGWDAAVAHGIRPSMVVGDFDSMPQSHVQGADVIKLPVHKDDTDMVVCLREGRARGYREFILAGCIGGRFDHAVSNLQCLADCALRGESAWMCDRQNRVTVLSPGDYVLENIPGRKLSLLAYTEQVKGVCLTGTLWELQDAELTSRYPLGCSNEITAPKAHLHFREGLLMVMYTQDLSFVKN